MVSCIIFDIDGTLIDESAVLDAQTSAVAWKFGDSLEVKQFVVDQFFAANDHAVAEGGQSKNDIPQYIKWMGEALDVPVTDAEAIKLASDWSQAFAGTFTRPQVFSDTVTCLEALKAKSIRLVIASGGTKEKKQSLLVEAGLAQYFDTIYAATDIGFQKQDRRFWEQVLTQLDAPPEQCLVVGNQINDDIMNPKALGMITVLVHRDGALSKRNEPRDARSIYEITDLLDIVKFI